MKTEQKNISEKEFLLLCNQSKEEIEIPQMLENKLDTLIDKLAAAEKQKIVALPDFWAWVGSIAAAVALILSIGFYLKDDNNSTQFADNKQISIDNLNQADREKVLQAERTLTLVSQNFNKGIIQLQNAEIRIKSTQNIINKVFKYNFATNTQIN